MRIGDAVADGSFASNPAFVAACDAAAAGRGVLHLVGLVSDGGVHSHVDHLRALVRAAARAGFRGSRCTRSPTGATSRRTRRADLLEALEQEWSATAGADRDGDRALLRDGSRRALRSAPSAPAPRSSTAWGSRR